MAIQSRRSDATPPATSPPARTPAAELAASATTFGGCDATSPTDRTAEKAST